MKYLNLTVGETEQAVSRIALGTAMFGARQEPEQAFAYMDIFVEAGGNCIDTARSYVGGESEKLVGRWLRERGARDRVVLSSKGCHPDPHDGPPRLGREDLREDFGRSLEALGTDHIDIYWIHKDDPAMPVEEVVENMAALLPPDKARVLGCSNWLTSRIERANAYAAQRGLRGFSLSQVNWNMAYTLETVSAHGNVTMTAAEYDWYLRNNMPVFGYGAQARGFFSKLDQLGMAGLEERTRASHDFPENLRRMERVRELARLHGASVAQVVLAHLVFNKLPAVAVIGSSSEAQLRESLAAADLRITEQEADSLLCV